MTTLHRQKHLACICSVPKYLFSIKFYRYPVLIQSHDSRLQTHPVYQNCAQTTWYSSRMSRYFRIIRRCSECIPSAYSSWLLSKDLSQHSYIARISTLNTTTFKPLSEMPLPFQSKDVLIEGAWIENHFIQEFLVLHELQSSLAYETRGNNFFVVCYSSEFHKYLIPHVFLCTSSMQDVNFSFYDRLKYFICIFKIEKYNAIRKCMVDRNKHKGRKIKLI
jgi:hypothetical protein